jgi:hypothetical protein
MKRIRRSLRTRASREFWRSFPEGDKDVVTPPIGENWWEAEKELSPNLLSVEGDE